MARPASETNDRTLKSLMVAGTFFVFLFGGPLHFVFELSGRSPLVGVVSAINESVWEHLKLTYLPILAWYLITYRLVRRRDAAALRGDRPERHPALRWLLAASTTLLVAHLFIVMFFYTYTGVFGIESLAIDILSLLVGVGLGQALALHVYRYAALGRASRTFAVLVPLILLAAYIAFTFAPPRIPLFLDTPTGTYGIWMTQ